MFWSCSDSEEETCAPEPDERVTVSADFQHFEDTLVNIKSKAALISFLSNEPLIRDYIFRRAEYPNDSLFVKELYNRFSSPAIDTLRMEVTRVFGDLSDLKAQFNEAFSNLKSYYPDFKPPVVKTVISGLDSDMLVSDSVIIISLDFYLGKSGKYRPRYYEYLLRRYEPEDIVPSCMMIYGIDGRFNKTNLSDKTVLADMIAYGKSFYFAKRTLPCVPDSIFMWYSAEELGGSRKNEDLIWARFVQDKVIFSTSMIDKRNYLGERPFTLQVGEKCPGRIGQWVGWRIVESYMKAHPDASLQELMGISDAQMLFRESRYKPKGK